MKKILLPLFAFMSMTSYGQNTLLKNATKGAIAPKDINNIGMVSNGTHVVLLAGDKANIYAIDIADNNAANAVANTVTSIPNFVMGKLDPAAGTTVHVLDMEVNPISKSVYVLAANGDESKKFIIKIEKNGATVSLIDLTNVTYSQISWGSALSVNDMVFGNGTLYVASGSFSLDGELGMTTPPFTHNSSFTKRSTTMFKSNWGGMYDTKAPLETLAFGDVAGKNRLMGVTTCAPGFSIEASKVTGTGLMQVTEDFNIHYGSSRKDVYMYHDKKPWLFDLHDARIYRIGQKYIDGSQVTANKHNNNAVQLRDNSGNLKPGLPTDDIRVTGAGKFFDMIAFWDNYRLLILENGAGALMLAQMSTETPPPPSTTGIGNVAVKALALYPNPAKNSFNVTLPQDAKSATVNIMSMNGSVVLTQTIKAENTAVDIRNLVPGTYTVSMNTAEGNTSSAKLTVE